MSGEILREAAELMRESEDRRWHLVAAWLDDLAAGWPWDDEEPGVVDWDGDTLTLAGSLDSHAVAIANAYVGRGR